MKGNIRSVQQRVVPGGVEVSTKGQSNRGTSYILDSVVVLREGKSPEEFKADLTRAVLALTA